MVLVGLGSNAEKRRLVTGISINGALKGEIGGSQTPSDRGFGLKGFGVQMENGWVT